MQQRKTSGLTLEQCVQIALLAKRRYGPTALGPYVSWSPLFKHWRAHVFIVKDGKCEKVLHLEPYTSNLIAFNALVDYVYRDNYGKPF